MSGPFVAAVGALTERLNEELLSFDQFEHELNELVRLGALRGLRIEVGGACSQVLIDYESDEPADRTANWTLDDRCNAAVAAWMRPGLADEERDETLTAVSGVVRAWWRAPERSGHTPLVGPTAARKETLFPAIEATLSRNAARGEDFAFVFLDVDDFKSYNDTFKERKGDAAIAAIGAALLRHAMREWITLHRTGDEFTILVPVRHLAEAVMNLEHVRRRVAADLAAELDWPFTMTMGLALYAGDDIDDLEDRAERVMKPGTTKLGGLQVESTANAPQIDQARATSLCIVRALSMLHEDAPFANVWLNIVSRVAGSVGSMSDLAEALSDARDRFELDCAAKHPVASSGVPLGPVCGGKAVAPIEFVAAATHGLLRAAIQSGNEQDATALRYSPDGSGAALLDAEGAELLVMGVLTQEAREIVLPYADAALTDFDARRTILVQIGHDPLDIAKELFAETVTVDDRPTRGGGLPDFWEAALAAVATAVTSRPNITSVVVVGTEEYGARTLSRLQNAAEWSHPMTRDELAYKTGLTSAELETASIRLRQKVTHLPLDAVVDRMLSTLAADNQLAATSAQERRTESRPLTRRLESEGFRLWAEDGCRVDSCAHAFPLALELARRSDVEEVKDEAGRDFRELIDFRIVLNRPESDPVPTFYRREESDLDAYFQREFVTPGGKFHDPLADQIEPVISHLRSGLAQRMFTTRRAILVVPHTPAPGEDLSPLGLVSVRIAPRMSGQRSVLHYSFTWRTVEALVGLPYSLYGSIRYARHLTDEISKGLAEPGRRYVELGTLSYIAHSLHVFTDQYGQSIARRIVEDASA